MSTECSTTPERKPNAVFQGMARHPNLFAFILAVIVSIIANYGDSFSSTKPMEVPPRQPTFWFSPHQSVVVDSPRGSLIPVVNRLQQDELVFVMFYAPWCSRSVKAKAEFEKAAVVLQGKVTFAAINCWWPEGECSKQYKFLTFPAFLAYHTKLDGFKFVGVTQADHMVKFVESLLNPLSQVTSLHQVQELIAKYDFVVFGFFDLMAENQIGSYRQFYYASMRILEKDPFQPVHFAVICNTKIAKQIHLNQHLDIIMAGISKNTTIFPDRNNITSSNLVTWVLEHKGMPAVKRISPLGVKSRHVSIEIDKGPALVMFHHESILFRAEPAMRVMKDVALQYKSCNLNHEYKSLHRIWRKIAQDDIQYYEKLVERCRLIRKSQLTKLSCCMSTLIKSSKANSLICDVCKRPSHHPCAISSSLISSTLSHTSPFEDCHSTKASYAFQSDLNVCCYNSSRYELNVSEWVEYDQGHHRNVHYKHNVTYADGDHRFKNQRRPTDRFYLDHLENLPRRLCGRLTLQKQDLSTVLKSESDVVRPALAKQFHELSCGFNGTLNFYSVDSKNHWMFTERLGMPSGPLFNSPGVVIFDKHNEEHYIMKENLTVSNTMSFILNYQRGNLKRHTNAHSFGTSGYDESSGSICVRELDSNNFLDVVKDENKDVVVLIYAHWCGFCQTLSHTFLSVAKYFSTSEYIRFVRINGDTNDLPWEYTVDSFPTILFFPAHRKADSVMFPPWKEKTRTNLIRFVLRYTTFDTRLLLAADVCSKSCIQTSLNRLMILMQDLRERYSRSHLRLKHILKFFTGDAKKDYYFRLSYDYFSKHLVKLNERIQTMQKLIEYLSRNKNGVINRAELINLFLAKD